MKRFLCLASCIFFVGMAVAQTDTSTPTDSTKLQGKRIVKMPVNAKESYGPRKEDMTPPETPERKEEEIQETPVEKQDD